MEVFITITLLLAFVFTVAALTDAALVGEYEDRGLATLIVWTVAVFVILIGAALADSYHPTSPRTETITVEKVGEDGKVVVVHDTRFVPIYSWYSPYYYWGGAYGFYGPAVVYNSPHLYGSSGIYRNVNVNKTVTVNHNNTVVHNHAAPAAPSAGKPLSKPVNPSPKPGNVYKGNSSFKPASYKPSGGFRGRR